MLDENEATMSPVQSAPVAVTKICRDLSAYWFDLRGARRLPHRSEVDPGAIVPLLPYLYILEMQETGSALIRLAGTALRQLYGIELTGRDMVTLAAPDHRATRLWRYRQAASHPCGMYLVRRQRYTSGALDEVEALFLPLATDNATEETPAKQFIGIAASVSGRRWIAEPAGAQLMTPHLFRFVDIGSGTPPTILPDAPERP